MIQPRLPIFGLKSGKPVTCNHCNQSFNKPYLRKYGINSSNHVFRAGGAKLADMFG